MLPCVFRVHVIGACLERKIPDRLDGNARVKAKQTSVGRAELTHRKTLNRVAPQESVDVATDVVYVGRQFKGRVCKAPLERCIHSQSRFGSEPRCANRVRPAWGIESIRK